MPIPTPEYTADFESEIRPITRQSDHYPPLISSGNSPQIVTAENGITPRGGTQMMKSVVNRFTSNVNYRTEAVASSYQNFNGEFEKGKEYWLGVSVFIPADWSMDYGATKNGRSLEERLAGGIILQFHDRSYLDKSWRYGLPLVVRHTKQGFMISNRADGCGNTRPGQQTRPGCVPGTPLPNFKKENIPMLLGQWNDFVMHVKWSDQSDGFIDIWVNGVKELEQNGVNYYSEHTKYPYFKMGLYQSSYKLKGWSKDVVYNVNERTLYHDELRIGGSESSFEEVSPLGSLEPDSSVAANPTTPDPSTPLETPIDSASEEPSTPIVTPNEPTPAEPVNQGNSSTLVSHYTFDNISGNTLSDNSDQNHTATIHGATTTTGKKGDALHFDGTNQYVDAGSFDVTGQAMTISAWIKADNFTTNDARIISKAIGVLEQDHYWMLSTIESNGSKLRFRLKTDDQTTTTTTLIGTKNIPVGKWVHVAAVYDGTKMKLFVDGQENGSVNKTGTVSTNPFIGIHIGDNPATGNRNFSGAIDDLRVYSHALSANDLNELLTVVNSSTNESDTNNDVVEVITNTDSNTTETPLIFDDGFENGNTGWSDSGSWKKVPANVVSSNNAREGNKSVHFLAVSNQKRSELVLRKNKGTYQWGKEYWVGFSINVLDAPDGYNIISQHHSAPHLKEDGSGSDWSCGSGGNSFTLLAKNGNFDIRTSTNPSYATKLHSSGNALWGSQRVSKPYQLNQWHDFVLHFKYATGNTGFMEVWLDGEKVVNKHNTTSVYLYDECDKPKNPKQYQKIGSYYGNDNKAGEILYDAFRIGNSQANYSDVAPGR
ncbi:MAG: heparin lyase I family protein [Cocleimonas sp.]